MTVLTLDHIVPLCQGGSHALWNLQLLCYPCNQAKADKAEARAKSRRIPPVDEVA